MDTNRLAALALRAEASDATRDVSGVTPDAIRELVRLLAPLAEHAAKRGGFEPRPRLEAVDEWDIAGSA